MSELLVVITSFPAGDEANRIADALVADRLAACVSLLPGATSTYRWKGAVTREGEVLAIIKTTRARFDDLRTRLEALHPYDVPEVVALAATDVASAYLAWVVAETDLGG